jgi:polar amino acid transport system substrate-binding protein
MKAFIITVFLLYALPFSILANSNVKSGEHLSAKEKVVLTVAIEDVGYFPFNYNENGDIKGFSVDVLNYFEANSKYDFELIILPWPRALYLVEQGKVDLILTLFKTPKREQTYHFIEPSYSNEVNQLFTLMNNKFEFNGQLQQLTPYSIGILREYSYGEDFDSANYLHKLPALSEEVLLKLLLSERVDMVVGNPLAFNYIISKKKLKSKVKAIKPYIAITPVYLALTKKREDYQEIMQTFKQLIEQLKASPHYQELLDRYELNFT